MSTLIRLTIDYNPILLICNEKFFSSLHTFPYLFMSGNNFNVIFISCVHYITLKRKMQKSLGFVKKRDEGNGRILPLVKTELRIKFRK